MNLFAARPAVTLSYLPIALPSASRAYLPSYSHLLMSVVRLPLLLILITFGLTACNPPQTDPNIIYSDEQKDPIKELEIDKVPVKNMPYQQLFYVPVYSNIYVDEDNPKVMLSATLSIRNTSLDNSLYVTKIDYYNTKGDYVRPYLTKSIELPPMGTLNYIVEKHDDTGGDGANFVVAIESGIANVKPLIETIMIGTFSNKGFSFKSDAITIDNTDPAQFFGANAKTNE